VQKIGPLHLHTADFLGITPFTRVIDSHAEILVYPEVIPARADFLSTGASAGWRDHEDALTRGSGSDFYGVREYRQGDEVRRINWKATARTGHLAVTEYTQGYANDVIIALDLYADAYVGSGSGKWSALEYAIKIAASLCAAALRQGSAVSLLTGFGSDGFAEKRRGESQMSYFLDALARAEATASCSFASVLDQASAHATTGTTLVCLTPEPSNDPGVRAALSSWIAPPHSASLYMFWLDKPAFNEASQARGWRKQPRAMEDETERDAPFAELSHYGREFHVGPATNLIDLLGRSVYG
jgi:uncharacterized protein (DUF58 family)